MAYSRIFMVGEFYELLIHIGTLLTQSKSYQSVFYISYLNVAETHNMYFFLNRSNNHVFSYYMHWIIAIARMRCSGMEGQLLRTIHQEQVSSYVNVYENHEEHQTHIVPM